MPSDHLVAFCTCPDREVATRLADALVDHGLAACVNIIPSITSVYRWQGKREHAEEWLMLIKTRAAAYTELEKTLRQLHPYELPEVIAVPIERGSADYLAWMDDSVRIAK